jgi:hypothetical protein
VPPFDTDTATGFPGCKLRVPDDRTVSGATEPLNEENPMGLSEASTSGVLPLVTMDPEVVLPGALMPCPAESVSPPGLVETSKNALP